MVNSARVADPSSWEVENLRLSGFTDSPIDLANVTWWRDLVGEDPEITESRIKQGLRRDEGLFEGNRLLLNTQLRKVDWIYSMKSEDASIGLPTIGPFDACSEVFLGKMSEWLGCAPGLSRLAFGAVLLRGADGHRGGYSEIGKFLPSVDLDVEGAYDFIYQINRPRLSNVLEDRGLKINRLSNWSVVRLRRIEVRVDVGEVKNAILPGSELIACRLELDINTVPEFSGVLPGAFLAPLFSELVEFGSEIASDGDVK